MHTYGGGIKLHSFLTSELDGSDCQLHVPAAISRLKSPRYPLGKRPLGPATGKDVVEKKRIPALAGN
jgi:hypothetical protein